MGNGNNVGYIISASPPPPKPVSSGIINGKATSLPKPAYPAAARAVRADGAVTVQITTDESGNVISTSAISGHPLLRQAAEQAAKNAKFAPTLLSGQPIKIVGTIVYNFNSADSSSVNIAVGEVRPATVEESAIVTPENLRRKILAEKLHVWLFALVERLQKGETVPTANEAKFIKDGRVEVQIRLSANSPEITEKLKNLGFEINGETNKNLISGKISVGKIADLAEIAEVRYILPKLE